MAALLNPVDAAFLQLESARTPMHVGGLMIFRLPHGAEPDFLRGLFAEMRSSRATTPPFERRVVSPRLPAWKRVPEPDMEYHVRHSALPYPGGERELGVLVGRLHSNPLDLSRPPWEVHVIEALENRRFALYFKVHHAALDGVGALRLVRRWLSPGPDDHGPVGLWSLPPREPRADDAPAPGLLRQAREQLRSAGELVRILAGMARERDGVAGTVTTAATTPRTLFNTRITPQRRLATQRFALDRFKAIGQATGASVNDVSLALIGGAIRRYLQELDALPLRSVVASVPLGLPRSDGRPGNAVAGFVCALGSDLDDPRERLRRVHAATARAKDELRGHSPAALQQYTLLGLSPLILGQMAGIGAQLRPFFNLIVSNVDGSRQRLYFRGAELEAMYPLSVVFDGYALNITIVGYERELCFGFTGCRDALPRLQRLAVYTGEALEQLERALRPKRRRRGAG